MNGSSGVVAPTTPILMPRFSMMTLRARRRWARVALDEIGEYIGAEIELVVADAERVVAREIDHRGVIERRPLAQARVEFRSGQEIVAGRQHEDLAPRPGTVAVAPLAGGRPPYRDCEPPAPISFDSASLLCRIVSQSTMPSRSGRPGGSASTGVAKMAKMASAAESGTARLRSDACMTESSTIAACPDRSRETSCALLQAREGFASESLHGHDAAGSRLYCFSWRG